MTTSTTLFADNLRLLRQGRDLVSSLDGELFGRAEPAVSSSGIGAHLRHMIDHYRSFLSGLANGAVDYDSRERNERAERDKDYALQVLEELMQAMTGASVSGVDAAGDRPLKVKMDACAARPEEHNWSSSSVERELQFLLSHTVHHYALIAVIMRLASIEPPEELGVAPSTLRYWQSIARTSPTINASSAAAAH